MHKQRYVRVGQFAASPYARENGCAGCGSMRAHKQVCDVTTCLACGTPQCMSNGGARGQCSICHYGLLPGWSGWDRKCGYRGCGKQAVAAGAPRVGNVCVDCLPRIKIKFASKVQTLREYVDAQIAARAKAWRLWPKCPDCGAQTDVEQHGAELLCNRCVPLVNTASQPTDAADRTGDL